ncbi:SETMR methyltransferase, partial [Acromyrmex charruanus]
MARRVPGPDGITSKVILRICLLPFGRALWFTFTVLLEEGRFPSDWKVARLVFFKKPNKPDLVPSSYRPICPFNELGKLFKRMICGCIETSEELDLWIWNINFQHSVDVQVKIRNYKTTCGNDSISDTAIMSINIIIIVLMYFLLKCKKLSYNININIKAHLGIPNEWNSLLVFRKTVPILSHLLKTLIFFSNPDLVKKTLPITFRNSYNHVQSIVDALEIIIKSSSVSLIHKSTKSEILENKDIAGEFNLQNALRSGQPNTANDNQLLAAVKSDRHLTTREIAERFGIHHTTVKDQRVSHELTEKNIMDQNLVCESLPKQNSLDPFLKRIITGNEK